MCRSNDIHVIQKKCTRILFGDTDLYKNKFKTCARTRCLDNQILGQEFYKKENTKPFFKANNILAYQNLYTYHCFMEVFKILKFRAPTSLFTLYSVSPTNDMSLITKCNDEFFIYQSAKIWNIIRKKEGITDFSHKIGSCKSSLKLIIHKNQHQHHEIKWLPSHDFDPYKIAKI